MKRFTAILLCLTLAVASFAQDMLSVGGIKGTVLSRADRSPVAGAKVVLTKTGEVGGAPIATITTGKDGAFLFEDILNGNYSLVISADDHIGSTVNVIVEKNLMRDLMFVTLAPNQTGERDAANFTEFDLDDSGYNDAPTILYGANDVFTDMAGFGFSSIRFKTRGYNSETQDVYLAGVKMNDAITGYSPFSLWSGLNEAMRSQDSTIGMEASDYGVGGINGVTNIFATPESVRPGWRFSLLSNSALYRLRAMASYATGMMDNGWAFAVNASARIGGNDWIDGVYYRNFAIYLAATKQFNPANKLSLIAFATPGQRGAQNASTQEVYDLMGDNMYNSNWGYQGGKVRNSRVRRTFEPVVALKYDFTPTDDFKLGATLLWRTGFNGYSALDWYDAMDPRPDYYRNLPSYSFMEDEDYNRQNEEKAEWATFMWTQRGKEFDRFQHLDWDRLYNVNYNNPEGRSKYALEERHVDQNDVNLALNLKWAPIYGLDIRGGLNLKYNRTESYKVMKDLLGGKYYLNIDSFAERDFAANPALVQNDLDYYFNNGEAQKITKGGKYGYDYLAQIRKGQLWASGTYRTGGFTASLAATVGVESFWREGLVRKGLFAGLDKDGNEIFYNGKLLTSYDANGEVISSYGKSKVSTFVTGSAKLGLAYEILGGHRISANFGFFNDAPTFNQSFISARTRNSLVDDLKCQQTYSADVNYQYANNGYSVRVTGFWTKINNQMKVMSFYDDSQNSFTNFAMTGIDQRHMGLEIGGAVPLPVEGLSLSAALSLGEYIYTSTPHMTQTIDNSAEVIRDEEVPYWASHPVYKKVYDPAAGVWVYDQDAEGNFVTEGKQKHYVPSTPQIAAAVSLKYRTRSYWFFELTGQTFAKSYLDMNPLYRTNLACGGADGVVTPEEVEYMAAQEEFTYKYGKIENLKAAFLLNFSVGKSWFINYKYNFGFSLQVNNILNHRNVRTGGYEQTRLSASYGKDRYYRFDSKYFYMPGANYMLNLYFRF